MQITHANRRRNTTTISKKMSTWARTITTAIIRTGAARRAIITSGSIAPTTPTRRIIRETITASVGTHEAKMDLGMMRDGARGTVTIIMMAIEIAIETVIDMAIGIPEVKTGNLAKAMAERCPAQRHGALTAPLGHPLLVLPKLGTPLAGIPDVQEVPASAQGPVAALALEVPSWTLMIGQLSTHTVQHHEDPKYSQLIPIPTRLTSTQSLWRSPKM